MKTLKKSANKKNTIIWPYLLAGGIFVSGVMYMIYLIFAIVGDFTDSSYRFIAPTNEHTVTLETEKYTVYYEYKTYFEGVYFDTANTINGLRFTIKNHQNNNKIEVKNAVVNSSYTNSDGSGVSVLDFEIKESGEYEISANFEDNKHEKVVLNIGKTMGWDFINSIFGIIGIFMGSILLTTLTAVFGAKWIKKQNAISI